MRHTKINSKAVSALRDRIHLTQQELAVHVGCSLSAVQFWEAGRSSPRGYRFRRLLELCPDDETRALFLAPLPPGEPASTSTPSHVEWEKRYLDPNFLRSLPRETRRLYSEAAKNILRLSLLKAEGNQVAAEGLNSLAEAIRHAVGMPTDTEFGQPARPSVATATSEGKRDSG
jgi:transcriptional regulator with XRE-family HTH domain